MTRDRKASTVTGDDPVTFSLWCISTADASCRFFLGRTSVVVGLYGPIEGRGQQATYTGLIADVSVRTPNGVPSHSERYLESLISDVAHRMVDCKAFPYMQLSVSVEIISNDGSLLSAVLNAFILAAVDLGIPLRAAGLAVTCSLRAGDTCLSPSLAEEESSTVISTHVICLNTAKVIYACQPSGCCSVSELGRLAAACQESASGLNQQFATQLVGKNHQGSKHW